MFAIVDAQTTLARMGADFNQFSLEFMGETIGTGSKVELNRLQLAQAVMGSPSLAEMVRWGEVGGDERALGYLQTILNPMPVCCMEFF